MNISLLSQSASFGVAAAADQLKVSTAIVISIGTTCTPLAGGVQFNL